MKEETSAGKDLLSALFGMAINWGATCLGFKLAAWCFDYDLTLKMATGIWLCICTLYISYYGIGGRKKK